MWKAFSVLGPRERLIAKLAILQASDLGRSSRQVGRLTADVWDIQQRVYRGMVGFFEAESAIRKAALSRGP